MFFNKSKRGETHRIEHLSTNLNCEWFNIHSIVFSTSFSVCLELFPLSEILLIPFSFLGLFFMANLI